MKRRTLTAEQERQVFRWVNDRNPLQHGLMRGRRRPLHAVLWILTTGAQWHLLPQSYPNYKTVHRRFQAWARQ